MHKSTIIKNLENLLPTDNKHKKTQCPNCLRKIIIKQKCKPRLEKLEEDIKYELNEILECMHKQSIDDYIMELECDMKEMLKKDPGTIESDFKTELEKMLNDMFENIIHEIVPRIKSLRKEVIKKHVFKTLDDSDDSD